MPPKKRSVSDLHNPIQANGLYGRGYDYELALQQLNSAKQIEHPSDDIVSRNVDLQINPIQHSGYAFDINNNIYKRMMEIADKGYHRDYPHYADDVYPQLDKIGVENSISKILDTYLPTVSNVKTGTGKKRRKVKRQGKGGTCSTQTPTQVRDEKRTIIRKLNEDMAKQIARIQREINNNDTKIFAANIDIEPQVEERVYKWANYPPATKKEHMRQVRENHERR